jgi:hypothetical protein
VVGRILDVQAQFQTNRFGDQLIVSNALLEVSETLKGPSAPLLRLAVEGGTVGDLTLRVSDLPEVHSDDRAVFFLDADDGSGVHALHDRGRGVLKLNGDRVANSDLSLEDVRQQVRGAGAQGGR